MGSLCGSSNNVTTQNQTSTNTPAGQAEMRDIYGRVVQAASTPYTPYTGQQVAGLSGTQQAGIQGITNAQGSAQPYFDQAAQYARQGAAPISAADIQRYQSPYTQQVIDATKANFQQDNAIGQQQVVGNAAMKGALGGDRVGVAKAELARQQGLAQNPVIAGLYNQGYGQALGAAQQDRAAQAQGAYTFGALAPSVQNAQISGAQAQIGAGGLEQGTNQAGLTAQYNDYLRQQAFPYQQAGFLASAGLPAVTSQGGTTTGTGQTTTPGPNPWVQAAGLGLSAASLFSDRRIKSDIKKVGKTFDGQPIYSFRYGDDPHTQMGLMAQDVEKRHPEAVGEVGGIKTVDYKAATADAEDRGFAQGGVVNYLDVPTYIPQFKGVGGGSPYSSAPAPMSMARPQQQADPLAGFTADKFAAAGKGLRGLSSSLFPSEGGNYASGMSMAIPSSVTGMVGGGLKRGGRVTDRHARFHETVHAIRQTLRGGGAVRGYAAGGVADSGNRGGADLVSEREAAMDARQNAAHRMSRAVLRGGNFVYGGEPMSRYADGGIVDLSPSEYVSRGFSDTKMAMDAGGMDSSGANALGPTAFEAPQQNVPLPRSRPPEITGPYGPVVADAAGHYPSDAVMMPQGGRGDLPPIMTAGMGEPEPPDDAMAFNRKPSPFAASPAGPAPDGATPPNAPSEAQNRGMGGWNPFNLSDDARMGLMSAGLGIAASRSPFALSAIGEGGQAGIKTYATQKTERQRVESEARRLAQTASQFAQNLGLHKDQLEETKRYHSGQLDRENNKLIGTNDDGFPVYVNTRTGEETVGKTKLQGKTSAGYVRNPDGTMSPVKGGPADPEQLAKVAKAKSPSGGLLPDDTADFLAERILAGDARALTNLGRGAQGAENIIKVQGLAARKAAERGMDPTDILAKVAEQSGLSAQQRTFGAQTAKMAVNATEAEGAIDLGRVASAAVPRTNWVPVNKAIQAFQSGTSDPALAKFGAANLAIINTYARAINPNGVGTVHDKEHAEKMLSTAMGRDAYLAVLDQMKAEIDIAHKAAPKAKQELERLRKSGTATPEAAPPPAVAAGPPAAPKKGDRFQFKQGWGVFDGKAWKPE